MMINVHLTLEIKQKDIVPIYKLPDRTKAYNNLILIEENILKTSTTTTAKQFLIEVRKQ